MPTGFTVTSCFLASSRPTISETSVFTDSRRTSALSGSEAPCCCEPAIESVQ